MVVRDRSMLSMESTLTKLIVTKQKIDSFVVSIEATFEIWDTVPHPLSYYAPVMCACIIADTNNSALDTLNNSLSDCRGILQVVNYRDSLPWDLPLFSVEAIGSSDVYQRDFIEYRNGSLIHLFSVDDMRHITRHSDSTLRGIVFMRDDLVHDSYECPFEISLPTFSISYLTPDEITINFESSVLEEFEGYQLINGRQIPYRLTIGTKITVDRLYTKLGIVRLTLGDGLTIMVKRELIEGKIEISSAG